jgi:hypothetical protein
MLPNCYLNVLFLRSARADGLRGRCLLVQAGITADGAAGRGEFGLRMDSGGVVLWWLRRSERTPK